MVSCCPSGDQPHELPGRNHGRLSEAIFEEIPYKRYIACSTGEQNSIQFVRRNARLLQSMLGHADGLLDQRLDYGFELRYGKVVVQIPLSVEPGYLNRVPHSEPQSSSI